MDEGIAKAVQLMDVKYKELEKRTEILEAELFEKSHQVDALHAIVAQNDTVIQTLAEQLESIDVSRRSDSVILRCEDFGVRTRDEIIGERAVEILSKRFPDLKISVNDFQKVYRLQNEKSIVCKFVQTKMRDELYERRFELARGPGGVRERLTPLYISEYLTAKNSQIFNTLLEAKRNKWIYTVYTRRGLVHFKADRESRGRRVDDLQQLKAVIESVRSGAGVASEDRPLRLGAPMAAETASRRSEVAPPGRRPGPGGPAAAVGGRPAAAPVSGGPRGRPAEPAPTARPAEPALTARAPGPAHGNASPPLGAPVTRAPERADGGGLSSDVRSTAEPKTAAATTAPAQDGSQRDATSDIVGADSASGDSGSSAIGLRLMQYAYTPAETNYPVKDD